MKMLSEEKLAALLKEAYMLGASDMVVCMAETDVSAHDLVDAEALDTQLTEWVESV